MEGSRRQFVAALTVGVTGTLAGCGDSESTTPTAASTDAPTATDSPVETNTATPVETGSVTATETPESASQVVVVDAEDSLRFAPASFTVSTGSTVSWEWADGGHNVKAETTPAGSDWSGTPGDSSTTYGRSHTHTETFETAGEYEYYCAPHRGAGMTGSFTVTDQ
jgi:plastocyanin